MHTHTLLIADDSIPIQRVIQLTFADGPTRVIVAADGQQALDLIEADRPDIILACTSLPDVDGYAIARHVSKKRHLRTIPVLLLTSRFDSNDAQKVAASGAKGVLEKPLDPVAVIARVKRALGIEAPVGERASGESPKEARSSARQRPARRRHTLPTTRKASGNGSKSTSGPKIGVALDDERRPAGAITPDALAQNVSDAVTHAITHAITHAVTRAIAAYEQAHGLAPQHAITSTAGTVAVTASENLAPQSPNSPVATSQASARAALQRLQRDMGMDDFVFDDASPRVAGSDNAVGSMPKAAGSSSKPRLDQNSFLAVTEREADGSMTGWDEELEWLAEELGTDQVKRTVPSETDAPDSSSDREAAGLHSRQAGPAVFEASSLTPAAIYRRAKPRVWAERTVSIAHRVLKPLRPAVAFVRIAWDTRPRIAVSRAGTIAAMRSAATRLRVLLRGAEVQVRTALSRLAGRCRSVLAQRA